MRGNYSKLYVHLVWATWDRLPLITPAIRVPVFQGIQEQAGRGGCELIAVGGIEDHVHVLLKVPTSVCIADVAKSLKGGSSHMVNHALKPGTFFKWQGSYGSFSVSRSHVPMVRSYVLNQERHHREGKLAPALERVSDD
ncbi:MAG TPA: IS200/IS605 family transposase [Longimicrobium sp.]|nr:IS200/IS605 family transposase [Longimicrobium sp.]